MISETHHCAVEQAVADVVVRFGHAPDLYLHEADLHAALYHALWERDTLSGAHTTRDGRRTNLVHRHYPPVLATPEPAAASKCDGVSPYDVVVLNPSFVRGHSLPVVANIDGAATRALGQLPPDERPVPILSAISVVLLETCSAEEMARLEQRFFELVRSEPDTQRAYLAVLFRHWDLVGDRQMLLDTLETWSRNHNRISLVFVQSYADDVGRVFGGRYLNVWTHMAPLMPLDSRRLRRQSAFAQAY
jgi:hypothetical protein